MARPTKLTPEVKKAIVDAIGIGAPKNTAATAAGIHYDTFNEWMKKGEKSKSGIYHEFSEAVRLSEGQAFLRYISTVAKSAAEGDARIALEFLKRRDPANWGDKIQVSKLSDDELLRLLALADRLGTESRGTAAGLDIAGTDSDADGE